MFKIKSQSQLKRLIHILNDGRVHSGETIGKSLGLTRAAIWKLIQKSQQCGLPIDAVVGKGYQLSDPISLLDQPTIEQILSKTVNPPTYTLQCIDQLPSTHQYLLQTPTIGSKKYTICLAEHQTGGQGRYGRQWVSPFAQHISLSIAGTLHRELSQLGGLSLAIACGVSRALKSIGLSSPIQLKWPNDILINGKKLAGILVSLKGDSCAKSHCVISVGMNTDLRQDNPTISQAWINLQSLCRTPIDRNTLSACLIEHIIETMRLFEAEGFTAFHAAWQKQDHLVGKAVTLTVKDKTIHGMAQGVDQHGLFLLKETGHHHIQAFAIGEARITI